MAVSAAGNIDALSRRPAMAIATDLSPTQASAVSWGAIIAGAAAAAALSLILLILGTGLGLSSVSPWAQEGISATSFGVSTIVWVTLTQLLASGLGGYLAGRLRTKWADAHTDEVYFRDTAHGFLAWAIATIATAALLTSVVGTIVGGGIKAGATVAGGAASAAAGTAAGATTGAAGTSRAGADAAPMAYFIDSLFRRESAGSAADTDNATQRTAASAAEVSRIFMNTVRTGALPAEDQRYVGQVIAQRTGLSQADAEKRVSETYARMQAKFRDIEATAKDVADKARKASAYAAMWLFISLLVGAFVASLTATFGGRQRDA